jgi:hypothetical protein
LSPTLDRILTNTCITSFDGDYATATRGTESFGMITDFQQKFDAAKARITAKPPAVSQGKEFRDESRHGRSAHSSDGERGSQRNELPDGAQLGGNDEIAWPDTNKDGAPIKSCANAQFAIKYLGVICAHDKFHDRLLIGGHHIDRWGGELSDHAILMLRNVIRERLGLDPGSDHWGAARIIETPG